MSNHEALQVAIQDLLCELRIGPAELKVMSKGYSPDYPGAPFDPYYDRSVDCCRVQLSRVVAEKLINAGVLEKFMKEENGQPGADFICPTCGCGPKEEEKDNA